jgi:hypothetical protein
MGRARNNVGDYLCAKFRPKMCLFLDVFSIGPWLFFFFPRINLTVLIVASIAHI